MKAASTSARAGLGLAEAKVAAAAHNLANTNTEGATRQTVSGVERPGGVSVRISAAARSGPDPVADVLSLKQGEALYRANLQVVAAEDERLGQTLDLIG